MECKHTSISVDLIRVERGVQSQKSDSKLSQNYGGYVYIASLPLISADMNLNGTYIEGSYLKGFTGSGEISRNIISDVYLSIGYRTFRYKYLSVAGDYVQNSIYSDLSYSISRKLMLSINYEGVYEDSGKTQRLYIDITTRF